MNALLNWIDQAAFDVAQALGTNDFVVMATIAIVLVSLICGSVGGLVVGNRMAFFSDALAHCSIAGVALGIISTAIIQGARAEEFEWVFPIVMTVFGILIGLAIAFVREKTNLASDTVIGVFFAAAIGLGAVLVGIMKLYTNKNVEVFLFGSVNNVTASQLLWLFVLAVVTLVVVGLRYNQFVFASFNPSLARSRRIPLRLYNYLFIVLLAAIVNICLQAVGILLINAMLIVPAAAAINLSRNMRQMFWWTIGLSLACGTIGNWINMNVSLSAGRNQIAIGPSGYIVLLSVLAFAASMFIGPRFRRQST